MPDHAHVVRTLPKSEPERRAVVSARDHAAGTGRLHALADMANGSPIQRARAGAAERIGTASHNRTGLPDALKAGVEALSGLSLDNVRVHRNSAQPARVGALAYAQGADIHLGPGQERHLPHEAWHVVQQMQGRVRATGSVAGRPLNDDPALEREASDRGAAALRTAGPDVPAHAAVIAASGGAVPIQRQEDEPDTEEQTAINHAEDALPDRPGEKLTRASLVLGKIPDEQWAAIGFSAATQNPELWRAFTSLGIAGIPESHIYPMFLDWFNNGVFTRSQFRALAERHTPAPMQEVAADSPAPMQMAAKAGVSGPKSYKPDTLSAYVNVSYTRNAKGSIDFDKPTGQGSWSTPIFQNVVDLEDGVVAKGYGLGYGETNGHKFIKIVGASRGNHFSIANRITGRAGCASPNNYTWHHLPAPYKMVLVDRKVHAQHNHNGGNLLWT